MPGLLSGIKVGSINSHKDIYIDYRFCFLPLIRFYLVSFTACFGHVARYTSSTTTKTATAKLRLFGKVNL